MNINKIMLEVAIFCGAGCVAAQTTIVKIGQSSPLTGSQARLSGLKVVAREFTNDKATDGDRHERHPDQAAIEESRHLFPGRLRAAGRSDGAPDETTRHQCQTAGRRCSG